MDIYLATDHAGFELKNEVKTWLENETDHIVFDCGANRYEPTDDFPDYITLAAQAVAEAPKDRRGIIFGGSGQGEAMVANRFKGVRAAVYYGGAIEIVKLSREHNDANILSLGARFLSSREVLPLLSLWLSTEPLLEDKYQRRISKMDNNLPNL